MLHQREQFLPPGDKSKNHAKLHVRAWYLPTKKRRARHEIYSSVWDHSVRLYLPDVPVDCHNPTRLRRGVFLKEILTVCVSVKKTFSVDDARSSLCSFLWIFRMVVSCRPDVLLGTLDLQSYA